ncbi:MAG: DUF4123 domain-containing protein [Thiomicrorhabdus sp.]|nr:DUF4123 domain-containing protein [Thiomicrorhabdus sp.]
MGDLSESLRATATYLIKIERHGHLIERLLTHWGQHQGIYAIVSSQVDFDTVYKHCQTLLRIKNTDNQTLYFRYYDLRSLSEN